MAFYEPGNSDAIHGPFVLTAQGKITVFVGATSIRNVSLSNTSPPRAVTLPVFVQLTGTELPITVNTIAF